MPYGKGPFTHLGMRARKRRSWSKVFDEKTGRKT